MIETCTIVVTAVMSCSLQIDNANKYYRVINFKTLKEFKRILVTSALPYANGSIHLGHLVEYIQTDVFVRFLKLQGLDAIYCCADDTHGTPIEINARKNNITPEELIARYNKEHQEDFSDFLISFDSYYSTNSPENKIHSDRIFNTAKQKGFIYTKEIEQTYCDSCKRFLPDRFVKGKCPKCGADDQYGDVCEKCNSAYKTIDLVDPYCTICKNSPTRKSSEHYFFKLSAFSDRLKEYLENNENLQPEIRNFVLSWITQGLEDWDITRDGPYFGFKIPGEDNKYYYVWLDAPVGYIASTENYCKSNPERKLSVHDFWNNDDSAVIHFIGKDIIYFHLLFWPASLMASDFKAPDNVVVHGFLTVKKEKMSKSRGTFLTARQYLNTGLSPELLRFYYTSNLSHTMSDIDLNWKDFEDKINTELLGNLANFAYRVLSFTEKNFDSEIKEIDESKEALEIIEQVNEKVKVIEEKYLDYEFREVIKLILEISALGNRYFQEKEPWKLIKVDKEETQKICALCINLLRNISVLIKPVLPKYAANLEQQIGIKNQKWKDIGFNIQNHKLGKSEIIFRKIDESMNIFRSHEDDKKQPSQKKVIEKDTEISALSQEKSPFNRLNLRVARIEKVDDHPDGDKLYVLQLDLGTEKRQIVSSIKPYYKKEELTGNNLVLISNLKPAKFRGVRSEGMLLAAEEAGIVEVFFPNDSKPGEAVIIDGAVQNKAQIQIKGFESVKFSIKNKQVFVEEKLLKTSSETVVVKKLSDKACIH